MGKQSTRENKTIYQLCREAAGLTRAEASDKMEAVSDSKMEKFEYETQEPTPYDIIQMADAYKRPDLCNPEKQVLSAITNDISYISFSVYTKLETLSAMNHF